MRLFLKLAVRNLLRNKRRTLISGIAIGIGLAALLFFDAMVVGMKHNMIASATESFLGDGQIHRDGYRETFAVEDVIVNIDSVTAGLRQEKIIAGYTPRAQAYAMISSPANVNSVSMFGVQPEHERRLSQIDDAIIEGSFFEGEEKRQIVIGSELAEVLEVELEDRVVLTVAQAHTGDLSQELFRVSGIFHFNVKEMDRGMAFVRLDKAQEMIGIDNNVHEIALDLTEKDIGSSKQHPFWQRYSAGGNEAVGWTVLMPELANALELTQFSTWIMGLILFGVVAFGIINTLFMSLHERMFEFGVLRAVGTRPVSMARLILFEAGALALLSIVIGSILGLILGYIFSIYGIDYTGIEFSGVTFREAIYPVIQLSQYIVYPLTVFIFTGLVALYPAIAAARLQPAEAMRRSF
jgi:ABC-type lipoprotein release transport system permease subunit